MDVLRQLLQMALLYAIYALVSSTLPFTKRARAKQQPKPQQPPQPPKHSGGCGERAGLLERPQDAFAARIALARSAERSLDAVYHTVQRGCCADAFFAELMAAADRGVRVRLLLDGKVGVSDKAAVKRICALANNPNFECRVYNPIELLRPWRWHALLHDKFLVADGQAAITGGRNIADKYYAPPGYGGAVTNDRDVVVFGRAKKGALLEIGRYIDLLWDCAETRPLKQRRSVNAEAQLAELAAHRKEFAEQAPMFYEFGFEHYRASALPVNGIAMLRNPIHAAKKQPWVGERLCELIAGAKRGVVIQTPYATRNGLLLKAMAAAAARVPVELVTNSPASSPNLPAYSNYNANRRYFTSTGAAIYEYQSRDSIHGKSMVVDGRLGVVGSFNMDERSFYIDTETMLVIDSPAFAASLERAIGAYRARSLCLCEERGKEHNHGVARLSAPAGKRAAMALVSVFSRAFQFLI